MELTLHLPGPEDTRRLGFLLGETLPAGVVLALFGRLGAGKTCLTQGLAGGLGVPAECPVVSPSYTLAHEYPGRVPLYHLDVYRLEGEEFLLSGLDEYFCTNGITVVEWAENIVDYLPRPRLEIKLTVDKQGGRTAVFGSIGVEFDYIVQKIKNGWS